MNEIDSYQRRPGFFSGVKERQWTQWSWQAENAVTDMRGLLKVFPRFPRAYVDAGGSAEKCGVKLRITPYLLSLIDKDERGNPARKDPVWRQVFPVFYKGYGGCGGQAENWEVKSEMVEGIAQHKYENRIIVYVSDCCFGHCMYCFRAMQSGGKNYGGLRHWQKVLEEIRKRPQVEEVILSGGDPLVYCNRTIGRLLKGLRGIRTVKAVRIHTRAWTYNPFRIDKGFSSLLKKYRVTEMGVHIIHPREITKEFLQAVSRVRASGAATMLMCDTPLIKGINDDAEVLRELFMGLYAAGVKPYYLSHCMPGIFARTEQRTSVRKGAELMSALKRRISNPAMPEYIIAHRSGKKTVPECVKGSPDFSYGKDKRGNPVVRFRSWKGLIETYVDERD